MAEGFGYGMGAHAIVVSHPRLSSKGIPVDHQCDYCAYKLPLVDGITPCVDLAQAPCVTLYRMP